MNYSDRAEKFVKENTDRYDLIYYGGTKEDSVFYDNKKQKEIKTSWKYFKRRIRKDPNICIGLTKEEKEKIFKESIKKKYGVENISSLDWVKEKKKKTYKKKYGVDHPLKLDKFLKKRVETNKKKYGTDHPLQNKEVLNKQISTNLERYGVKSVSQLEEFKEKRKKTCLEKYGVEHAMQSDFVKSKVLNTNIKKYGVEHSFQSDEVKKKIASTCLSKYGKSKYILTDDFKRKSKDSILKKYGTSHPMKNPEVLNRLWETKEKLGQYIKYCGVPVKEWAAESGLSYSYCSEKVRYHGPEILPTLETNTTFVEKFFENFLKKQDINFTYDKKVEGFSYRPDFLIENKNLIIECDGLYWHSENFHDKKYHQKKLKAYESLGFRALFFRSDEILDKRKFFIVKSIVFNQLKKSEKIYARKCRHSTCKKEFFNQNHLMGKGQGRIYALEFGGEIVSAMQVKWRSKKKKILEISRFCTKLNTSVVGGWSKILKRVIERESPNKIITFVDRRYGSGKYLKTQGWTKENEDLSFRWTNYNNTFHRMKFPGNSGYEKGLVKIWDCGQARWELIIN